MDEYKVEIMDAYGSCVYVYITAASGNFACEFVRKLYKLNDDYEVTFECSHGLPTGRD